MLPYLHSQGGVSRHVSLIYHYTHYTYTQLPRFQHHSLCVYAESREYALTNYSYYVTAKTKKTSSLRKSSLYTYGAALRIRTVDLLFTKQLL